MDTPLQQAQASLHDALDDERESLAAASAAAAVSQAESLERIAIALERIADGPEPVAVFRTGSGTWNR